MYKFGTSFMLLNAAKETGNRRPLKPVAEWDTANFASCFEPEVTDALKKAHSVAFTPRVGHVPSFWKPASAPVPKVGGLIDTILNAYTNFKLPEVDPTAFEEGEDAVFARLTSANGFTCPAGVQHAPGTHATVRLCGGSVMFTCHGPQRSAVLGFGNDCCREFFSPPQRPLFYLKPDKVVKCQIDESGVERGAALPLADMEMMMHKPGSERRNAVGIRMRMGSGKSKLMCQLAREFLEQYPGGRIVYASSHQSLTDDSQGKLEKALCVKVLHYDVQGEQREQLFNAHVVVCTSSLSVCIGPRSTRPTLLIIDEPQATASMAPTLGGVEGVSTVVRAIANCPDLRIVCLDAHLDVATQNLLAAAGTEIYIVEGESRPCKNFSARLTYATEGLKYCKFYFVHVIAEHVRAHRNVMAPCSTKAHAMVAARALRLELGDKVQVLTVTGDDTAKHKKFVARVVTGKDQPFLDKLKADNKILVVLFTTTMGIGISAMLGLFRAVVVCVASGGPAPAGIIQMVGRYRAENGYDAMHIDVVIACKGLAYGRCASWCTEEEPLDFRSMGTEDQAMVKTATVLSVAALRDKDFRSQFGSDTSPGCGPFFLKEDGKDKVHRINKIALRPNYEHSDAVDAATAFSRLAGAARNATGSVAFRDLEAGAQRLSYTYSGCPFLDRVLTIPSIERENRAKHFIPHLELLLMYEFGTLNPAMLVAVKGKSKASDLMVVCAKLEKEMAYEEVIELARKMKENWFTKSPQPLYDSDEACLKDMCEIVRKSMRKTRPAQRGVPAKNLEPEPEMEAEPHGDVDGTEAKDGLEEEEMEAESNEEDMGYWNEARKKRAFLNIIQAISSACAENLVDKMLAFDAELQLQAGVDPCKMVFTKGCLVAEKHHPDKVLSSLYKNQTDSRQFLAYAAERSGKNQWDDSAVMRLGKEMRVFSQMPAIWELQKAKGIMVELGIQDIFGLPETRTYNLDTASASRALLKALNGKRTPSHYIKAGVKPQGLGKAIRSELAKVGLHIETTKRPRTTPPTPRLLTYTLVLPPLVAEYIDTTPLVHGTWDAVPAANHAFWVRVYERDNERDVMQY